MTKAGLLTILCKCADHAEHDPKSAHIAADQALLDFIADDEITAAFDEIDKWYA